MVQRKTLQNEKKNLEKHSSLQERSYCRNTSKTTKNLQRKEEKLSKRMMEAKKSFMEKQYIYGRKFKRHSQTAETYGEHETSRDIHPSQRRW